MQPPTEKQKLRALIGERKARGQRTVTLERELALLQARDAGPGFSAPPSSQPASSEGSAGTTTQRFTTGPGVDSDAALFELADRLGR
jgi:hypothetical protein